MICGTPVFIDDEDFDIVFAHKWYKNTHKGRVYAGSTRVPGVLMHRLVMRATKGQAVDHIDGDSLNNQKSNLRFATRAQNMMNRGKFNIAATSRYKGVHLDKRRGIWMACVKANKVSHRLGDFETEIAAARAYDQKCLELHGEFAKTNVMLGLLEPLHKPPV